MPGRTCRLSRRQHRTVALATLFIFLVCGSRGAAFADTTYWRVTIDRVTVVSDAGPQRCSRLATQLLAFEGILRGLADWPADFVPPPLALYSLSKQDAARVLLSESERRKQRTDNMMIYSKFLPGPDFNIAAIVDEGSSDDPLASVLLLYARGLLTSGGGQHFPPWYQLGVSNLLNGLLIRTDGSVLLNRNIPFEPIGTSASPPSSHYDLPVLLDMHGRDMGPNTDYKEFMRRAREWAEFGLLTTPERRSRYRELALLMRQGTPAADAVKDAFGMPLEQLVAEFESGKWRKDVQYRLPAPTSLPVVPTPEKLDIGATNTLLQVVAGRAEHDLPDSL